MNTQINENRNYLVRTEPELVEKSIVGIGWSGIDLSSMKNAEEAIIEIKNKGNLGRCANQIRRFFNIDEGDFIVTSLPYSVAIGKAKGGIFYDESYIKMGRPNQRLVNFHRDENGSIITIPRKSFSEAFQRRLRVRGMTVNSLDEFSDEISEAYNKTSNGDNFSWGNAIAEKIEIAEKDFKETLFKNIQNGKTNLQTGGIGLENLVKELLQIEGYQAAIFSKRAFPSFADADVKATRSDTCVSTQILVQVKHHSGFSNQNGLKQLEEISKIDMPEYQDYQLVFCTSAEVSEEFLMSAEAKDINVVDGRELVEWINQNIEGLSIKTKHILGICEVPTVIK